MNIQLTDVVKNLLIINILFFVGTAFLPDSGRMLALFYFKSPLFAPYQLATHFFMHAGFGHLLFNMFGLVMFGPALEKALGEKKFLIFYFLCAFGATLLHTVIQTMEYTSGNMAVLGIPVLGASGAIYGILTGFATKFPKVKLGLLFLPIMLPAYVFIGLLIGYDLISGISTFNSGTGGTAHFAHIGGAAVGFILAKFWGTHGNIQRWN